MRIRLGNIPLGRDEPDKQVLPRIKTRSTDLADVTLINLNLMLVNQNGIFDQQNYVPLGLLYIAACLEEESYNVELIDYQLFAHAKRFNARLFAEAAGPTARLLGISCMSNLLPYAILCARELKKGRPDLRIILGGVGPSPVAREILAAFPYIDSVVEGEGELTMLQFMKGPISPLPRRRLAKNLARFPLPAYSLVDFAQYDAAPSIITSRGCPYRCAFCTEPHNFGNRVRFRSVESVVDELELVHALSGRSLFLFQDDTLPLNRARFRRLMKAFRNLSFPMRWKCFSRVDLMDEELMSEMAETGCVQIRYGIESGSNKTLKRIRKGFTIEQAYAIARRSAKYFPSVHASFIWGYPFENMTEFEETLNWVSKFEEGGITVLLFEYSPLPGSPLYKKYNKGLTFSKDHYSFYVVTGHEVVKSDSFQSKPDMDSAYSLIQKYPKIFSGFYQYENLEMLKKQHRLEHYHLSRRSPVRNEYDC